MLAVQEFLHANGLEELKHELGIVVTEHPDEPLVILNYHQVESPRSNPIARQCRGLVLERNTWATVARSFDRFFNWGEFLDEAKAFNWHAFVCQEKLDGSLILLFHYNGKWWTNTRGSFGGDKVGFFGRTWRELCLSCSPDFDSMDKDCTYVCELTGPHNKVVRRYFEVGLRLLSVFIRTDDSIHYELPHSLFYEMHCRLSGLPAPEVHSFTSLSEIEQFLLSKEKDDPSYEGVVIRDVENRRWKIKSKSYLGLHRMSNGNAFNPKYLLPFVLTGERDELLAYFPEAEAAYDSVANKVNDEREALSDLWTRSKNIEGQKEFALAVVSNTRFSGILFKLRKAGMLADSDLIKEWRLSGDIILKQLKDDFSRMSHVSLQEAEG